MGEIGAVSDPARRQGRGTQEDARFLDGKAANLSISRSKREDEPFDRRRGAQMLVSTISTFTATAVRAGRIS